MEEYTQDSPQLDELDVKNRVQNLMWTVSGDYGLDTEVDTASFEKSKYISLYDAIKQGAFARYFDKEAFGGYVVRKVYLGADSSVLMRLGQLCVDSAVWKKASKERIGVPDVRKKAFADALERDFFKLTHSYWGKIQASYYRYALYGMKTEERTQRVLDRILRIQDASDTMEVIRCLDEVYNDVCDKEFESRVGGLERVLAVPEREMQNFNWQDYLNEEARENRVQRLMDLFQQQMYQEEAQTDQEKKQTGVVLLDEEAIAKMDHYIELNYGKSYLTGAQQRKLNRRLCTGAHADSRLHFTDGILAGMVQENSQSVYARKVKELNLRFLHQNARVTRQNIQVLANILQRALVSRTEQEQCKSDCGRIQASRLWNVGKTSNRLLFDRSIPRDDSDFAVEILIDASGSQRKRQSLVALQAYILSEALSRAGIPQRVMGFCSFWDYTVMRRFRDYEEGPEANRRIFEFYGSANNRDGLAIRAAAQSLDERQEENKILIVLSDGRPNDLVVNRPNSKNTAPYCLDYAVRDTAIEVRKLRNRGIAVLGVFAGVEEDLAAEKRIFGKDFAYIKEIGNFARVVGRYLKKQLAD